MPVPFFNDLRGSVSHPTCSAPRRAGTDWGLEAKRQNVETRERRSCWCENPFSYPRTRSALPVRPGLTAARRWASRITYAVGVSEHSPGSVRRRRAPPWVTNRMNPPNSERVPQGSPLRNPQSAGAPCPLDMGEAMTCLGFPLYPLRTPARRDLRSVATADHAATMILSATVIVRRGDDNPTTPSAYGPSSTIGGKSPR